MLLLYEKVFVNRVLRANVLTKFVKTKWFLAQWCLKMQAMSNILQFGPMHGKHSQENQRKFHLKVKLQINIACCFSSNQNKQSHVMVHSFGIIRLIWLPLLCFKVANTIYVLLKYEPKIHTSSNNFVSLIIQVLILSENFVWYIIVKTPTYVSTKIFT